MGIAPKTKIEHRPVPWIRWIKIGSILFFLAFSLSASPIEASNSSFPDLGAVRSTRTPDNLTGFDPLQTPSPEMVWVNFESTGVSLAYPNDWQAVPLQDTPQVGSQKGVYLLCLAHQPDETVVFSLAKRELADGESIQVEQADQETWNSRTLGAMTLDALDALKLHSHTVLWLNGQKAIQRIFEYPLVDASSLRVTGKQYIYQVLIVEGDTIYQIEMVSRDAAAFSRYISTADDIVSKLQFQPSAKPPRAQRQWGRFFNRPPKFVPLRTRRYLDT